MNSQNTSIKEPRVTVVIDSKGDTIIQFKAADAKIILKDVLDKQVLDTIVKVYVVRDSLQNSTITLQLNVIKNLENENKNKDIITSNLDKVVMNKDSEITKLNVVVEKQKKEIRKQKFLKITAYITGVLIPLVIKLIVK